MTKGCGATMVAMFDPSHTHVCTGTHDAGDHLCTECQRYFYQAPKKVRRVQRPKKEKA